MKLKQSTAVAISFGCFVDKTDGVTLETGLVTSLDHGTTGIKLSKNGGALTIRHATVTATTYDSYGNYIVTLDTTDTNTLGTLRVQFVEVATCLAVWMDYEVVSAAVWDWFHGSTIPPVNTTQFAGSAITSAAGIPEVKVASIAANAITASSIAADAITAAKVADGTIDRATFAADTGLQSIRSNTAQAGGNTTITLDASASATNSIYVGAWVLLTGGTGAGQTRLILTYDGGTKIATVATWQTNPDNTSTFAILPAHDIHSITQVGSGAIASTSFSASAITAAAIATDAIDADALAADAVAEIQSGLATSAALATVQSDTDDIQTRLPAALGANGNMKSDVRDWIGTAVSSPTVAGVPNVNAKTWNDLATVALPLVPTTAGRTLDVSAGGEAGIDWANVGSPTTAVDLSGTTIKTTQVVASVTGAVGSVTGAVGSVTGAVGSVTGNVGGNVAGSVGSVTGNVGGNVTGSVGSLAAQAKADVNAEVVDCLNVDTYAEPTSAPAATSTLRAKIGWIFKLLRNRRTQTATTETVYADDGTTADSTSTKSDDGTTLVRGEFT